MNLRKRTDPGQPSREVVIGSVEVKGNANLKYRNPAISFDFGSCCIASLDVSIYFC